MTERPFHHGNLRAVLLDEAVAVLRESGIDGLSLRDLARRAGVSHGAPDRRGDRKSAKSRTSSTSSVPDHVGQQGVVVPREDAPHADRLSVDIRHDVAYSGPARAGRLAR